MPNTHDILTGSRPDGTAFTDAMDHTCNNYTSNTTAWATPSSDTRISRVAATARGIRRTAVRGCSQPQLVQTGGAGLLYCFAVN